ncbi:hypothetical protein ACFWM0_33560 [Streptomyces sp. NPDC058405]|uniref:BACON domain-containing protein n=1 Tax=Streptomyces sp. NPDC058405 TaxID=3346482 RepID=UPI00365AA337
MCSRRVKGAGCLVYRRRVTSSSPETSPHTTGAHRASRRAPRSAAQRPPARDEPYLDGLFTYCLSVLCDHGAATEVLGDVLSISERQYGRCPSGAGERKAWLYALARWACLRRLTELRRQRQGAHSGRRERAPAAATASAPAAAAEPETAAEAETAERHRRELAALAWPEAAGTTPEQREILELAVRHQLGPREVAAVLSMELPAARELLASAACEVDRTRAALAVVETGDCPSVARLTGDSHVLLSAALRRELVRHVDDCPRCRRAAERAGAVGPWPGSPSSPGTPAPSVARTSLDVLPLVEAPRAAAYTAMTQVPRARGSAPRFGRNGFPVDPKDRAARRRRLRARAVTTTVVATVVAAPVLALWAAYRGAPLTGEGHDGSSISAGEGQGPPGADGRPYDHYENAGNAQYRPGARFTAGGRTPDVSVEVISDSTPAPPSRPGQPAPGRLTVEARSAGDTTMITLRASGAAPVSWSARTGARWLLLSSADGTLEPGESITIRVFVDHRYEPAGPWSARIALYPSGSVVKIDGYGSRPPSPDRPPRPGHPGHSGHPGHPGPGSPTPPGPSDPGSPGPTEPGPPDPSGPGPTDPGPGPGDPDPEDPDPDPSYPDPSVPEPSEPSYPAPVD